MRKAPLQSFGTLLGILVMIVASTLQTAHAQSISLLRDAEIEQWLRDYSDPIFEVAGLEPQAVEIYLVGDTSLNAFVTAGLKMFVHTGLITSADNPNQIQGVIAHETGHLAGGHQQRGADAAAAATRPAMLSLVLGAAIVAAGGGADAGLGVMALGQTIAQGQYLAYNRSQESAADQAAASYLEEIGASGDGLVEFFSKLSNQLLISSRQVDPYLMTHPLPIKRMNALRSRVATMENNQVKDTADAEERLKMIQAKINGFMQDPQVTMRQYPLRDQSLPAQYGRAVAYYRASELDRALKAINSLIDLQPENPFFMELKGQMLFEYGKIKESVAPHRRSTELAPQYALLKINLGRALVAAENVDDVSEAVTILKSALLLEPENSFGWSELARAYAFLGDEDLASLAQAQSFYSRGDLTSAHRFASRVIDKLEVGTPDHLHALDIITASADTAERSRNRRSRR